MADSLDLGLHFLVGLSGTKLSDIDKEILETVRPSGVLLLKRNFLHGAPYHEWLHELDSLYASIKSYTGRDKIIVSLDHEGGRVHRTPTPLTHFPSASHYSSKAYEVGKAMATELRSIGVNISWSPCTDIHSNPANPVIGDRAFGSTPNQVADAASRFLRGLLEEGVVGCAKHFPGHGDTDTDSHLALPTLHLNCDALKQRELIPFVRLINEGVPLVMTSHILFPNIDPQNPATLSPTILKDILRRDLGFGGIIVTDDLDMKAVADRYPGDSLVCNAINAGCELFIVARFPDGTSDKPRIMHRALVEAVDRGDVDVTSMQTAQAKIEYLVSQAIAHSPVMELDQTVLGFHQQLLTTLIP